MLACFLNVQQVCSDAASFDLPAWVVAGAIEEAGTAAELAMGRADGASLYADSRGKTGELSYLIVFELSVAIYD